MSSGRKKIAVIGSGIAGLSAAWHLSQYHDVDLIEKDDRLGGHSNTVDTPDGPVDTGFIVYNERCYPNLIRFFEHLDVDTCETDMSFGVSINQGELEYAGRDLKGMFAQASNILKPGYWRMIKDILRFYKEAPMDVAENPESEETLGEYLVRNDYSRAFIQDHLIPMGAAIWSTPSSKMLEYPLLSFIAFCSNHGLLQVADRPQWRTVIRGSRSYVTKVRSEFQGRISLNRPIKQIRIGEGQDDGRVLVESHDGWQGLYDDVVLACHGDQAKRMLTGNDLPVMEVLDQFTYQRNRAILHTDSTQMPRRKSAWCSWNYLADRDQEETDISVTYWMNNLQPIPSQTDYFVTLNPITEPAEGTILRSFLYDHPVYDLQSVAAQKRIWAHQGQSNLWFCGSYLGYGFHEDGIQSGLAVAEALTGHARPWPVPPESDRVNLPADWNPVKAGEQAGVAA